MNKTQKGALFMLGMTVLFTILHILIFSQMFSYGPISVKIIRTWCLLILLFMVTSVLWLNSKRSRAEVVSDERDSTIKKKAVLISFASLWILSFAAPIVPTRIVGDSGSIPVCLLPIINFGLFLVAMMVYSVAVLVQYGWGGKDGTE